MALRVTFWGTRGSIPVSLDSASIRDKLARAIVAASAEIWRETLRYEEISRTGGPLRISVAYDGLEIEL